MSGVMGSEDGGGTGRDTPGGAGDAVEAAVARALKDEVLPLHGAADDLDPLLSLVGEARCVLIGEATHGTHEFYRLRAELTQRLIREKGFGAVAVEADWPDAYRVGRFVRCLGADASPLEALADFRRFPAWMWRNEDVLEFIGWLRQHNEALEPVSRVGFYGLDLYSLHASMEAVVRFLDRVDVEAARRARARYGCFDHFPREGQAYAYATFFGSSPDCEREVVSQLLELQRERTRVLRQDGLALEDEQFVAEQNARVVQRAEEYYRTMFGGHVASWNLRDTHMADTLDALLRHLERRRTPAKVVVWAHNSHVGDARATELGEAGEVSLGQLARERHPDDVVLIGFSTHEGSVTAASAWGGAAERKQVRAGLRGSFEALFHRVGVPRFTLPLWRLGEGSSPLRGRLLERAIGVVYLPEAERVSHYFHARLAEQFDALLHIDRTHALEPLERAAPSSPAEAPETFPSGM